MTDIKKCSDSGDLIIVINRRLFMNSVKKSFLAGLIIIITGMIFVLNAKVPSAWISAIILEKPNQRWTDLLKHRIKSDQRFKKGISLFLLFPM